MNELPDEFAPTLVMIGPLLKLSVTGLSETGKVDAAGGAVSPVSAVEIIFSHARR